MYLIIIIIYDTDANSITLDIDKELDVLRGEGIFPGFTLFWKMIETTLQW